MRSTKLMWSGVIVLVVLLFASYLVPSYYFRGYAASKVGAGDNNYGSANNTNNNSSYGDGNNYGSNRRNKNYYGYGMMGGYGGMMGGNWGSGINQYANNALSEDEVNKDMEDSLKNATVDKQKNTVSYSGEDIKIVVLGGPKQADEKFIIGGLINPTVYIPKNSNITLEFINEDEGMYHNVAITNAAPPYAYMNMMQGQIYPGSYTGMLPPAANDQFYSDSTTFNASYAGEFYYLCQYPGHAAKGMYGKIIVK
jgi:rusticyanin